MFQRSIEGLQLLFSSNQQNKAELENPILLKRWIFLFKIFSQFVNLKYPMHIFLWTVLFSFNCLDAPREDQDHWVLAWLYAYFMNISLDAAFMTIWPSCFSFVILTTSEQLLSIDPQTSPQNPLPSHFWTNFKLKPTILPCLWFLKSVRKTHLNFLKENLLLQMILCLVSGCQKTLTHSNNMARWKFSQVKTNSISPTQVTRSKSSDWLQSWVGYQHSWDILSLIKTS